MGYNDTPYWILRGKRDKLFCWNKHRAKDGGFWVWTRVKTKMGGFAYKSAVRCSKKYIAERKARQRYANDYEVKQSIGYVPKDRTARLAAFKRYAEARKKQGRDEEAATWEMRAVALEQDIKDNPEPVTKPKSENEIEIERVQEAITRWTRKAKLASTKLKKLNRKLTRLLK